MAKKKQNTMTLDDLAQMVKRGFDSVDQRFDGVDKRLDGIDQRFDGVDKRLDGIDQRIDKVEQIQRDMLEELNATHTDVRHIRRTVDMLVHNDIAQDATIQDLTTRVHRLEQKAGLVKLK